LKAVRTETTDLELTLPGAGEDRTLPAQRIQAFDPELGETEEDAHHAILTTWRPELGERRALVNGALVELVVHGTGHPPVSLTVGEPEDLEALLLKAHVDRAIGFLFSKLSDHLAAGTFPKDAPACLELWAEALEQTADGQPIDLGAKLDEARERYEEAQGGNGDEPK
jgi:hypothetical protein